jgi:asparaginyl-tRNA synthetase
VKHYDSSLLARLQKIIDQPFARIPYREAISLLQKEISKAPSSWKYSDLEFGTGQIDISPCHFLVVDLATEHERWLAEKYFNSCVFVYDYPKEIKVIPRLTGYQYYLRHFI